MNPELFVPIVALLSIAAVFISFFSSRQRERMAMIEKGLTSDEIKALYTREIRRDPLNSLKWGILFVLGGVAIILGNFLRERFYVNDGAIVGMVILFVGIGLVIFYSIATKKLQQ